MRLSPRIYFSVIHIITEGLFMQFLSVIIRYYLFSNVIRHYHGIKKHSR